MLPLLSGTNLTDKGCLSLNDPVAQTNYPHHFDLVPPGLFEGCNATNSPPGVITVEPWKGWASLNFISTASVQELVGKFHAVVPNNTLLSTASSID